MGIRATEKLLDEGEEELFKNKFSREGRGYRVR